MYISRTDATLYSLSSFKIYNISLFHKRTNAVTPSNMYEYILKIYTVSVYIQKQRLYCVKLYGYISILYTHKVTNLLHVCGSLVMIHWHQHACESQVMSAMRLNIRSPWNLGSLLLFLGGGYFIHNTFQPSSIEFSLTYMIKFNAIQ